MLRDIRRIVSLAWPVLIGQLAVVAFGVIDTAMVARYTATDLAALALGGSIYITVYVGMMGVLVALSPIAAQLYGAHRHAEIGEEVRQALWLAAGLSVPGMALLLHPYALLHIADAKPALEGRTVAYLQILALGLPAALAFRVYSSLSNAIARPRIVMMIQLIGLALKIPLNFIFIYGTGRLGMPLVPALGSAGCALATTLINWVSCLLGLFLMQRHSLLRQFGIYHQFSWPQWPRIKALLKLGVPMGLGYLIEVTAFTFMAIFIARFGAIVLAGHQIAANLGTVLYMLPMSLGIACATLVAQALGARDFAAARRLGRHGISFAVGLAMCISLLVWMNRANLIAAYTPNSLIAHAAAPLFVFVTFYHVFDAMQVSTIFVLRAYKVAVVPTVIYAVALWGVGLGGGYALGFDMFGITPHYLLGASGFWFANSLSLGLAAAGLMLYLHWISACSADSLPQTQTK
ncbi:MAG: MATE family efflux transporter [Burkholderiales bacterium]|nr:MATE family efflux transporter [Burkholderiales bacterium]MDE2287565.1 MATE family efflux transporter [Burkholderiales bacterium]MDE2610168.1 MATE family efflux transporter [Burkholderiales bacterium]